MNGIMKATQEIALSMLRAGKQYVQTGEVLKTAKAKGYTYPVDASKYAYSYLRSCRELENFKLDQNKRIYAWRLKEPEQ